MNAVKFVVLFLLLSSFAFAAAPVESSCGGSVLTAGQSVSQGEYSVKISYIASGNPVLVAFQVFKNGQNPWFSTTYSGRTVTSTNYPDVTVQVCSASDTDNPKWADVKVTVNVPTAPAPSPAPEPTPAPAPSPAPEPAAEPAPTAAPEPTPAPAPSPAPACSAPSLSGSGYSSNGYTVRLSLFTGHEGDSVRHPVLQVLKNGNPVTFLTIWNVGIAQTVSGLQPLNGDSLQVNVCEADAASNVVKGTVSVSLATPAPEPPVNEPEPTPEPEVPEEVPVPEPPLVTVPASTCGGTVLTPGAYVDLGNDVRLVLVNVYSNDYVSLQIKYREEHKGFLYLKVGQGTEKAISTDAGSFEVSVNVCSGGTSARNAEVQADITGVDTPGTTPTRPPAEALPDLDPFPTHDPPSLPEDETPEVTEPEETPEPEPEPSPVCSNTLNIGGEPLVVEDVAITATRIPEWVYPDGRTEPGSEVEITVQRGDVTFHLSFSEGAEDQRGFIVDTDGDGNNDQIIRVRIRVCGINVEENTVGVDVDVTHVAYAAIVRAQNTENMAKVLLKYRGSISSYLEMTSGDLSELYPLLKTTAKPVTKKIPKPLVPLWYYGYK